MLSVRDVKGLARKLDEKQLARQLGPFVLVQRPYQAGSDDPSVMKTTRRLGPVKKRSVLDFEDLWVATLPPFDEMDAFSIGRSPDCDVVIDQETVSKRHARIDWLTSHAELEDLGSSNGTFLNGQKLRGRAMLHDNDAIDFGHVQVFFLLVATLRKRMG
jgi:FHA domain